MNKQLYLSFSVFSTAVLIEDTVKKQTNIINQLKLLKIPTGRRQTSWLFTKRGGIEFGATKDKSISW